MAATDTDHDPSEQPLVSHLLELRTRLLRSLGFVAAIFVCLVAFSNDIYIFVSEPLLNALPEGTSMIATDVTAPFFAPFKLTLMVSVFLAIPFLLNQAWAFIAPGLYKNEIRVAFPILVSSILLFYVGVAFAYYVVLGFILNFFVSSAPETVQVATDISSYLSFAMLMFFAFGITFEIPVATVLLISAGVTTPQALAAKRRYVVVLCFLVGMMLTPPDPFSQSMLAIPMWMLFEIGILAGRFVKKRQVDEEGEEAEEGATKD